MPYVELYSREKVLVDEKDYAMLSQHKWQIKPGTNTDYARTQIGGKAIPMHRMIMQAELGMAALKGLKLEVDHINGNGLDNRRCNLRLATRSQNKANTSARNGYKGIKFFCGKWRAKITFHNRTMYIGSYDTAVEAAKAYDATAKELFGEYAKLNFKEG